MLARDLGLNTTAIAAGIAVHAELDRRCAEALKTYDRKTAEASKQTAETVGQLSMKAEPLQQMIGRFKPRG